MNCRKIVFWDDVSDRTHGLSLRMFVPRLGLHVHVHTSGENSMHFQGGAGSLTFQLRVASDHHMATFNQVKRERKSKRERERGGLVHV